MQPIYILLYAETSVKRKNRENTDFFKIFLDSAEIERQGVRFPFPSVGSRDRISRIGFFTVALAGGVCR